MATLTPNLTRSEMARTLPAWLDGLYEAILALLARPVTSGEEFLALEQETAALGARVADSIVETRILEANGDKAWRKGASREARARFQESGEARRVDNQGNRAVSVRLAGGTVLPLMTPYLRPLRKGMVGRPRTKRGPDGSGCYPVLEKFGIQDGVTPLTRSRISRQMVQCGSYAEAQAQLRADGLDIDVSTMVRVAVATGTAALERRDEALARALDEPLPEQSLVEGRRIRVSVDGGRARTRSTYTKRRKKKNGRRSFKVPWREPRLLTVDLLDNEGKHDPTVPPIYEVDLGQADRVFELLAGLLRLIGAHKAAEITFVSDGADWIWDRVDGLVQRAELDPARVHTILDFYHASEHVADALRACHDLSEEERKSLHKSMSKQMLEPGGVTEVIERLSKLARGRRGKRVNREIRYLRKHVEHMRYAEWRAANVPIGSGVVESAIRRVINLRFKAASTFWREDHLAALLCLRCALKAGRWDEFMLASIRGQYWLTRNGVQGLSSTTQAAA
jgi:hypothetical protein